MIPLLGTIRDAAGNLFNGFIRLILSYGAAHNNLRNELVLAEAVAFPVTNGTLPATARITPNDILHPQNTTYTAQYLDQAGRMVAQNVFYITGDHFDIGAAVPTPITTSNISFDFGNVPINVDNLNAGNITATSASISTLQGNQIDANFASISRLNAVRYPFLFPGANAGEKIQAALTDLPATGGTVDARDLEGNQTWVTALNFGGKPTTLILGAGITTVPTAVIPDYVDVVMPSGAIFNLPGTTMELRISQASSLSQHFTGSGTVRLKDATVVHTRWFDDGSHSDTALQLAINSIGDTTTVMRAGQTIMIDDVLTLQNTILIDRKAFTLDGGGIAAFSSVSPSPVGGLIWNGPGNQPMIEVTNVSGGSVIQNLRFYGNTNSSNRPRSAISYVDKSSSGGTAQGRCIVQNCHIGMMFGDTGYDQFNSLVDGIRVGDPYDGGDGNVNDLILIDSVIINGCTNAAFRQSGIQNSLADIRHLNVFAAQYGIWAASTVSLHDCFIAGIGSPGTPGSIIYTPLNDDYGLQAGPYVWGYDVSGEQVSRYIWMKGTAFIDIKGGGFQLQTTHTATDRNVIFGESNNAQSVLLQDMVVFDIDSVGAWNISMKAAAGQASPKVCRFHGTATTEPTFDMSSQSGYDVHMVLRDRIFPPGTTEVTAGTPVFPQSFNILVGNATDFSSFDPSRFHVGTKYLRVGDTQNGAGAWEITTNTVRLATTSGTSVTATALLPANVMVIGVTARAFDNVTVSAGTIRIGSGALATKWATDFIATSPGDHQRCQTTMTNWDATVTAPYNIRTAEDVIVSVSGGSFTGGSIEVSAFFVKLLPPPGKF